MCVCVIRALEHHIYITVNQIIMQAFLFFIVAICAVMAFADPKVSWS